MTDSEFLNWVADRLVHVYHESDNVDFVLKLRRMAKQAEHVNDKLPCSQRALPEVIAQLRHLYRNLVEGGVRDTASAKRIATGLLGPVIEQLERKPEPVGPWKCGNEFLPYHPSASHVEPGYRDGWNACYLAAAPKADAAQGNGIPTEDGIRWQSGNTWPNERKAVTVDGRTWYRDDHEQVKKDKSHELL